MLFRSEDKERESSKRSSGGGWNYPVGARSPHAANGGRNGTTSGGGMEGMFGVTR